VTLPPQASIILVLRACAALTILWHHYALYAPFRDWAAPLVGETLDWLANYARATQVFFVVGGYVAAKTIGRRQWCLRELGRFSIQRYARLGLPYLAVVVLIIPIYEFARGWVPEEVLGSPVGLGQFLAHVFFLQDILGYESLSAGLWFVCINFQLSFGYAFSLALQHRFGRGGDGLFVSIGWGSALFSLFHFNLVPAADCWALYFFPYFFMGILVQRALERGTQSEFLLYQAVLVVAMLFEWRWRLVIAMVFGMLLFVAEGAAQRQRWSSGRLIAGLGRISFSLFLVHFPVLILVSTVWSRLGWDSAEAAVGGLGAAFMLSLLMAAAFYRWIELPCARLSRCFRAPENLTAGGEKVSQRMILES
jgi:peptidoglycan/LPS O-acetylase OafA/YrhL